MLSSKLKTAAVAAVILALATFILWQQQRAKQLTQEATALRGQVDGAAARREENQRLAEELRAARDRSQADRNELMRLRGQVGKLRQVEQEIVQLRQVSVLTIDTCAAVLI